MTCDQWITEEPCEGSPVGGPTGWGSSLEVDFKSRSKAHGSGRPELLTTRRSFDDLFGGGK